LSGVAGGPGRAEGLIGVILADDHAVVRQGIRDFLEASGKIAVLAEASDGLEAMQLVRELQPDVAVLDIQMPGQSGIEVTRTIRAERLPVGVLILTAFDDPPYVTASCRRARTAMC
jgi:two-component system response regulator DegU